MWIEMLFRYCFIVYELYTPGMPFIKRGWIKQSDPCLYSHNDHRNVTPESGCTNILAGNGTLVSCVAHSIPPDIRTQPDRVEDKGSGSVPSETRSRIDWINQGMNRMFNILQIMIPLDFFQTKTTESWFRCHQNVLLNVQMAIAKKRFS